MKKVLLLLILSNLALNISLSAQCNSSLWKHVYNPERFKVWKKCTSITGTINLVRPLEADGDYHILLHADPGQGHLLNQKNMDSQRGCLVIEIICVKKVTQTDAIEACKNCPKNITIPKKGQRVKVTGSFVTDQQHGWNEIHPVSSVEVL
jgi:hypothetical protein